MSTDNSAYSEALTEIEEGRVDKGVWARAFAESEGNDSKTKAAYIRARVEAMSNAGEWSDTRPPLEELPSNSLGIPTRTDAPALEHTNFYNDSVGTESQIYYLDKFKAFDKQGAGLHISWNWAAFIFGGLWALYRKMYGWFFAWWAVATVVTAFSKVPDYQFRQGLFVCYLIVLVVFAALANSLYQRKIKARIVAATNLSFDVAQISKRLTKGSGVHTWVPYIFGSIPVIGIILALALPAFKDVDSHQESFEKTPQIQADRETTSSPTSVGSSANSIEISEAQNSNLSKAMTVAKPPSTTPQKLTAEQTQAAADLEETAKRIVIDYPFLDTPQGEEALQKIIARRDELVANGTYPSLALQRAANAIAPAYAAKFR